MSNAYIYRADIYCEACANKIKAELGAPPAIEGDSETYPQGPYSHGGGEADTPQHCGGCDVFLKNALTSDGIQYVRESIELSESKKSRGGSDNAIVDLWQQFYGDQLGG